MEKVLNQKDIVQILPFCKNKTMELLRNGVIPTVKVGRGYITTESKLNKWINDNIGKEV